MPKYSDVRADFGKDTTSKKVIATDMRAIEESINNIITTSRSERFFRPDFWCGLNSLLWEPMSENTALDIMQEIDRVLSQWEYRIRLKLAQSVITPLYDENRYDILLVFEVIGLDGVQDLSLNLEVNS